MQRGDRRLELVRADRASAEGRGQDGLALGDRGGVPQVTVLVVEADDLPVAQAGRFARVVQQIGRAHV